MRSCISRQRRPSRKTSRLLDRRSSARYDTYELERTQFETTSARLRLAWLHNSESDKPGPDGYPVIGVFTPEESYAILRAIEPKILEKKLDVGISREWQKEIETSYAALLSTYEARPGASQKRLCARTRFAS